MAHNNRRSSFARSFFDGGGGHEEGVTDLDDRVAVPKQRPGGRKMFPKQLSFVRRGSKATLQAFTEEELLEDVEEKLEVDEEDKKLPSSAALEPNVGRPRRSFGESSNNLDLNALEQQQHQQQHHHQQQHYQQQHHQQQYQQQQYQQGIAGDVHMSAAIQEQTPASAGSFPDEEVLEQYRIMAQYEARVRVKENTGMDIEDFERKIKTGDTCDDGTGKKSKKDLYGGGRKIKLRLPPSKLIVPGMGELKAEKAPTPPLGSEFFTDRYIHQQLPRNNPEMCPGILHRGSSQNINTESEHVVRCLGCRSTLRVNFYATLVSCPECNVVSSTTSTRI